MSTNCPDCHNPSLKKNGTKSYGQQNYQCTGCKHQLIGNYAITYQGYHSKMKAITAV
ncbi:IS1/IS1595 family N-terminal zinc-binding domain-containing protein [Psychrobacter sp. PL15]|uniref:IS1/IS1595 family N-terminal zinc-binding domain-containing protein n=1 Tax=Psychrobacter sp. PL15 TaxID=3071719 RepID=UPI003FA381AE